MKLVMADGGMAAIMRGANTADIRDGGAFVADMERIARISYGAIDAAAL